MSRSTTLAIVHPVDKLQGSDDAVRTQVWEETTHLLTPMLGKLYARFEPAQKAWRQATYTPLGVVLGRTDPALFLYFFSYGKTMQKEAMEFHLSGLMNSLAVDQKVDNGNIHSLVMSPRENSELSEESPLHYNCFIDREIRLRFRSTSVTLTITCSWSFTTSEGSLT